MQNNVKHIHKLSESALCQLFAAGDENAFKQLFEQYSQPLCYFGQQLTQDREEAEDMAVKAFHQLWQRHKNFNSLASIRSFLYTTVRNQSLNYLKHRKVVSNAQQQIMHLLEKEDAWADARLIQTELVRKVYAGIESLSPRHQTIVKLSFLQGLSTAEIAAQMELSENHIRAERSRALSRLRETLSNQKLWEVFLIIWAAGLPLQKF